MNDSDHNRQLLEEIVHDPGYERFKVTLQENALREFRHHHGNCRVFRFPRMVAVAALFMVGIGFLLYLLSSEPEMFFNKPTTSNQALPPNTAVNSFEVATQPMASLRNVSTQSAPSRMNPIFVSSQPSPSLAVIETAAASPPVEFLSDQALVNLFEGYPRVLFASQSGEKKFLFLKKTDRARFMN